MTLRLQAAPARSAKAVSLLVASPTADASSQPGATQAEAAHPIPIYALSLGALAGGGLKALAEAQLTGWRFLVFKDGEAMIVDVPKGKSGARLLRGGGMGERLAKASVAAEKIVDDGHNYQVRILDFHPMSQPVLWLRGRRSGEDDHFISLGRAARPLSGQRLLDRLRRKALDRLKRAQASRPDRDLE